MKSVKTLMALAALGLAFASGPALAAEKIGVVDMRAILSSSPQAKSVGEKLKSEFKAREDKIIAMEKGLREKSEKLQRNAAVMSEAEKTKLEKEVVASQRELQRLQNDFREDAGLRQQEETRKLVEKINKVIQDVAKKEQFDLIVHSEAAPYAAKQVDITDKVIKAISANG